MTYTPDRSRPAVSAWVEKHWPGTAKAIRDAERTSDYWSLSDKTRLSAETAMDGLRAAQAAFMADVGKSLDEMVELRHADLLKREKELDARVRGFQEHFALVSAALRDAGHNAIAEHIKIVILETRNRQS